MVIDTSAILAILFAEPQAQWFADQLEHSSSPLLMSTVNLAECLILIRSRQPKDWEAAENVLAEFDVQYVAPSEAQARVAAMARLAFPLNLGDCFAYALAKERKLPIITNDADFRATDAEVCLPDKKL